MNTNRTFDDVIAQWQRELDTSLETGETPVFYLNAGATVLGDLAGPIALQWLDEERRDAISPLVAAGGVGPAWLLALLHTRLPDAPLRSPGAVTVYTGPDAATHAAALSVIDTRRSGFRRRPAELPPAFQPTFVPSVQAGAAPLESTSFVVSESENATMQRDGWTAWVAVVLAVALFLIALVA